MILVKDNNGKIHQTTDGTNAIIPSLNVAQEVLWTNANPAQSFTPQSVNLNSSKASYDYILFSFYNGTGQEKIGFNLATSTKPPRLDMPADTQVQIREVSYIDDSTVRFENGVLGGSTDNSALIPYQIIGIKFLDTLNYSTEEQYTGKHWIDGKKIYEKTYINQSISIPSNGWADTSILSSSIGDIVSINNIREANGTIYNNVGVSKDQTYVRLWGQPVTIVQFTLQYTKTTE